jgi:hypothetical protein
MLRTSGGGSHVIQANAPPFGVTLAGLFATPVSCSALATSPQSSTAPEVLPTSSVRVRTRTGRIKPMEPPSTAPFFYRLSVSSIRFTRRSAAHDGSGITTTAFSRGYALTPLRGWIRDHSEFLIPSLFSHEIRRSEVRFRLKNVNFKWSLVIGQCALINATFQMHTDH